jgi:uncharacterized FlaG/YvyC family protein
MSWELYEVWLYHKDGYEELLTTTKDLNKAKEESKTALAEDIDDSIDECVIFREDDTGTLIEISRLHK